MTSKNTDQVFVMDNADGQSFHALQVRSYREGLFGKKLEDALQTLIEEHPELLPGRQMAPGEENPPRFALLCREMPVGGGWLDHLLVDQAGILTLVETKLFQNPEARREVVGQAIEYAANALGSWANGQAREKATQYWARKGKPVDDILRERLMLDESEDMDEFWAIVEDKLEDGYVRLIIAADELRAEVRRSIEYLNKEMRNTRVYGLELRTYGDNNGPIVLVPYLVGYRATDAPSTPSGPKALWRAEQLRTEYEKLNDQKTRERLLKLLGWAVEQGCFLETNSVIPGFGLRGRSGKRIVSIFPDWDGRPGWVQCLLEGHRYVGYEADRANLVRELKVIEMYPMKFDPDDPSVKQGPALTRRLSELPEQDFAELLSILGKYCAKSSE